MSMLLLPLALSLLGFAPDSAAEARQFAQQLAAADPKQVPAALAGLKQLGADGVEGLLEGTHCKHDWVRVSAWQALADMKGDAEAALGPLCRAMSAFPHDATWMVTAPGDIVATLMTSAFARLLAQGKPFPIAKDETPAEQALGARSIERLVMLTTLLEIGRARPDALVARIRESELPADPAYADVYAGLAMAIGSGEDKEARYAQVLARLEETDPRVLSACLIACYEAKKQKEEYAERIVPFLDSTEPNVRGMAWQALVSIAPAHEVVHAKAAAALADESAFVRVHVARALTMHGDRGELALPVLQACLRDPSPFIRAAAIAAFQVDALAGLKSFGKKASPEPTLFRPKAMVAPLTKALADKDPGVRYRAADALGSFGKDAKSALPALKKAAKDADKSVRTAAERSIGKVDS